MSIKFIFEEEEKKQPMFGDVEINQPFVDGNGYLCFRRNESSAVIIADDSGVPFAAVHSYAIDAPINRILPHVERIEF